MIILDTDHLSALQQRPGSGLFSLQARLEDFSPDDIATTAITVEEQMRGWMAHIRRYSDVHQQVPSYERLIKLFDFFAHAHEIFFYFILLSHIGFLKFRRVWLQFHKIIINHLFTWPIFTAFLSHSELVCKWVHSVGEFVTLVEIICRKKTDYLFPKSGY